VGKASVEVTTTFSTVPEASTSWNASFTSLNGTRWLISREKGCSCSEICGVTSNGDTDGDLRFSKSPVFQEDDGDRKGLGKNAAELARKTGRRKKRVRTPPER
jgi:hypothetical protein